MAVTSPTWFPQYAQELRAMADLGLSPGMMLDLRLELVRIGASNAPPPATGERRS
jgi:hypothetical protein